MDFKICYLHRGICGGSKIPRVQGCVTLRRTRVVETDSVGRGVVDLRPLSDRTTHSCHSSDPYPAFFGPIPTVICLHLGQYFTVFF